MRRLIALYLFVFIVVPLGVVKWEAYKEMHIWGPAVVRLLSNEGGGTGFQVKWHGKQYTMTNDHVCEMADKQGDLIADSQYVAIQHVRVLRRSANTDLCLLTPVQGLPALELGDVNFKEKEEVVVLGHPHLRPLEARHGSAQEIHEIDVVLGVIGSKSDADKCTQPKNRIIDLLFGLIRLCTGHIRSQQTTAKIQPGSSGSPVLDKNGYVRGVAFASGQDERADIVPLDDVLTFLKELK